MNYNYNKIVEVKRDNGETEYIETNELKLEIQVNQKRNSYLYENTEKYHVQFELNGETIGVDHLNFIDLQKVFGIYSKAYNKLYEEEIKGTSLLDAGYNVIEREHLLRTLLTYLKENYPVHWDQRYGYNSKFSEAAQRLLDQTYYLIPQAYKYLIYTKLNKKYPALEPKRNY
jgi:hypothetical protein